jgi:hypothetical protein
MSPDVTASFTKLATVTATTNRLANLGADGKRAAGGAEYLTGLKCTPLMPLDPELRQRLAIETNFILLQTFVQGDNDIVANKDLLNVGGVSYPIRAVEDWDHRATSQDYQLLVVEQIV